MHTFASKRSALSIKGRMCSEGTFEVHVKLV